MPEITCDYMVPLTVGVNTDTGEITHVELHLESFQFSQPGRFVKVRDDGETEGFHTQFRSAYLGGEENEREYACDGDSVLGDKALAIADRVRITNEPRLDWTLDPEEESKRFFADLFDADGKWYVFDGGNNGEQAAGPFTNQGAAIAAATDMNAPDSAIERYREGTTFENTEV